MPAVRTIGIVVVTVGFIGLVDLALARAVPPALVFAPEELHDGNTPAQA
jgi:hypothetical protein